MTKQLPFDLILAVGRAGPHECPVDVDTAAGFLGVAVRLMRRQVAKRATPPYKLTGRLAFGPADLRQLREAGRLGPGKRV